VIITKICTISTSKRSICLNICVVFLSWALVVSSLTLLHGREYVHTERWPHARLHSSFLDQTDSDKATRTVTPAHVTTSMQLASRASDRAGKASTVSASQYGETHRSGSVTKILRLQVLQIHTRGWVQKQTAWQEVWLYSAHIMFLLLIGGS